MNLSFAKSASESRGRSVRVGWSNTPGVGWAVASERGRQPAAPPRRGRSYRGRVAPPDPHAVHSVSEGLAIDVVAIAEEVGRRGVVREGVHDLLGRPVRGGVFGDVEVDDPSPGVDEHDETEEHPQARGGHREEVEGDQVPDMVGQEHPPGLRRRGAR